MLLAAFGPLAAAAEAPVAPTATGTDTPAIRQIIDYVDRLYRSNTSYSRLEMSIVNPNWQRRLEVEIWTRDLDQTFILIQAPRKDAGIATLRRDVEMWNYFPKVDKVMKVPPSMMMSSWMGSDFTNDDLVKESTFLDDYSAALFEPPDGDPNLYYIELTAREEAATVWAKIEIAVRRRDFTPVEQVYFDDAGRRMRRMTFSDVRLFDGRPMPAVIEVVPLHKEGHRTVIRYLEARFDQELDPDTFSLRNLRRKR